MAKSQKINTIGVDMEALKELMDKVHNPAPKPLKYQFEGIAGEYICDALKVGWTWTRISREGRQVFENWPKCHNYFYKHADEIKALIGYKEPK